MNFNFFQRSCFCHRQPLCVSKPVLLLCNPIVFDNWYNNISTSGPSKGDRANTSMARGKR